MKYTTKLLSLLLVVSSLILGIAGCASAPAEKDATVSSNNTTAITIATMEQTLPSSAPTTPTETVHIHTWTEAICTMPKTCTSCGVTEGTAKEHNYVQGRCAACNAIDPNANSLVWIPTKRGTKYHYKSTCSKMNDPKQVTKFEAISQGFEPCANCYKQK